MRRTDSTGGDPEGYREVVLDESSFLEPISSMPAGSGSPTMTLASCSAIIARGHSSLSDLRYGAEQRLIHQRPEE